MHDHTTTRIPPNDYAVAAPDRLDAPAYGESSRDAIRAIISGKSEQNAKGLNALRREIDELEQLMLVSAAKVSADIDGHATICRYLQDEVNHLHGVLDRMKAERADLDGQT